MKALGYIAAHDGVWFATGSEVAHWWLEKGFSAEANAKISKVA